MAKNTFHKLFRIIAFIILWLTCLFIFVDLVSEWFISSPYESADYYLLEVFDIIGIMVLLSSPILFISWIIKSK